MLIESSVVILAAGKSSRMGKPKFLLKYDENATFLEQIMQGYETFACNKIIVVLNEQGVDMLLKGEPLYMPDNIEIVINRHPERERFYSLKLALETINFKGSVFVHNVDNPFVNKSVLQKLLAHRTEDNYVVPEFESRRGHPVLLSGKLVADIVSEEKKALNLKEFLKPYLKQVVKVDDKNILVNINAKDDYIAFRNNLL